MSESKFPLFRALSNLLIMPLHLTLLPIDTDNSSFVSKIKFTSFIFFKFLLLFSAKFSIVVFILYLNPYFVSVICKISPLTTIVCPFISSIDFFLESSPSVIKYPTTIKHKLNVINITFSIFCSLFLNSSKINESKTSSTVTNNNAACAYIAITSPSTKANVIVNIGLLIAILLLLFHFQYNPSF